MAWALVSSGSASSSPYQLQHIAKVVDVPFAACVLLVRPAGWAPSCRRCRPGWAPSSHSWSWIRVRQADGVEGCVRLACLLRTAVAQSTS